VVLSESRGDKLLTYSLTLSLYSVLRHPQLPFHKESFIVWIRNTYHKGDVIFTCVFWPTITLPWHLNGDCYRYIEM